METLWRWTSHYVVLVVSLNIGCIFCQNVGPNSLLQGEPLRDFNPGNPGNPQLQINNLIFSPRNGGPIVPDCQKLPYQDDLCLQNFPQNQQASNVPILSSPCTTACQPNVQAPQNVQCAGPGFNSEQLSPIPKSILPFPYSIGDPCLSQQSPVFPSLEMLPQGPLLPFSGILPGSMLMGQPFTPLVPVPNLGISILPPAASSCQQTDKLPFTDNPELLSNQLTSLIPTFDLQVPCKDVQLPQGMVSPSFSINQFQPLFSQRFPEALINVFPLAPQLSPVSNTLLPLTNNMPTQEPILSATKNCLPQDELKYDVLAETQSYLPSAPCPPSISSPFQKSLPLSPINMFKLPRPTLFPSVTPFQGPLVPPCDPVCTCPNLINPALIQQEPIYPQTPLASNPFVPNNSLGLPSQSIQQFTSVPSSVCQTTVPLNPGPCSLIPDVVPVNFISQPIVSQSNLPILPNNLGPQNQYAVDCPPIAPLIVSPCQIGTLPLVVPNSFNRPSTCDSISLCQSATSDTVPIPISLQINVPPPIIPAPRITIINALPAPTPSVSTTGDESTYFDLPYPMPPVIIEGRRSKSRSWLPLVLVALFARDGEFGGYGSGNSCDSDPMLIPYPIAIPTNNPVIVNK